VWRFPKSITRTCLWIKLSCFIHIWRFCPVCDTVKSIVQLSITISQLFHCICITHVCQVSHLLISVMQSHRFSMLQLRPQLHCLISLFISVKFPVYSLWLFYYILVCVMYIFRFGWSGANDWMWSECSGSPAGCHLGCCTYPEKAKVCRLFGFKLYWLSVWMWLLKNII